MTAGGRFRQMLGIVVLNWNQAEATAQCVRSLDAGDGPPGEVWVVDNGSRPEDRRHLARELPAVRLVTSERNLGFGGGNNRALEAALAAGCEAVLLLNNDARLAPADLERLRRTLAEEPGVGLLGPPIWDAADPGRLLSAGGRDIALFPATHRREPPPAGVGETTYVPGTCVLLRSAMLEAVGLLDEEYFFSGELADLAARARRRGFAAAIDGRARATHDAARPAGGLHALYVYYEFRNRSLYARKFHPERRRRLVGRWAMRCAGASLRAAARRDGARARALLLAGLDGVAGRFGNQNRRVTRGRLG